MLILMGNCMQGYARICQSDYELNLFSAFSQPKPHLIGANLFRRSFRMPRSYKEIQRAYFMATFQALHLCERTVRPMRSQVVWIDIVDLPLQRKTHKKQHLTLKVYLFRIVLPLNTCATSPVIRRLSLAAAWLQLELLELHILAMHRPHRLGLQLNLNTLVSHGKTMVKHGENVLQLPWILWLPWGLAWCSGSQPEQNLASV